MSKHRSRATRAPRHVTIAASVVGALLLSGCSHVAEIIDNPSIEHERFVEEGHMVLTVSGDRRLIRTTYDKTKGLLICAETQADAISARSASSALEAVGKGALSDEIIERLTMTYARTELSDVVRQIGWQLCNAQLNKHLTDGTYEKQLVALQNQAMIALAHRSPTDQAAVVKEIQKLHDQNEAAAEKERAHVLAREQKETERSAERTRQLEAQRKQAAYEDCRKDAGDDKAERAKCREQYK